MLHRAAALLDIYILKLKFENSESIIVWTEKNKHSEISTLQSNNIQTLRIEGEVKVIVPCNYEAICNQYTGECNRVINARRT